MLQQLPARWTVEFDSMPEVLTVDYSPLLGGFIVHDLCQIYPLQTIQTLFSSININDSQPAQLHSGRS